MHQLVDDIDGTILDVGEGETVYFALDGVAYEVDLSAANSAAFRDVLAPYVSAARSVSAARAGGSSAAAAKRRRTGQPDYSAIRAWAKDNGYAVSERGRVPATVTEAYDAAH